MTSSPGQKVSHYKPVISFLAGTHYGQDSVRGRKEEWHRLLVSSLGREGRGLK